MTEPAQRAPAIVAEALAAGLRRRLLCVRRFQTGQFGDRLSRMRPPWCRRPSQSAALDERAMSAL
jgi:hypothetical protein